MEDASTAQRSAFHRAERWRSLTHTERDLISLAQSDGFGRWLDQMRAIGGCSHPIYLAGHSTVRNTSTDEVLHSYSTRNEPYGVIAVRCRNRRIAVCEPCSRLHAGDTYQLVRAGLLGGKETPESVTSHPRLFVTFTAPSFGAVHRVSDARCRPRRDGGQCEHGRPIGCGKRHSSTDAAIGQPLCPDCYDYPAHVLWHAHAGALWDRTTRSIRRHLATAVGITQKALNKHLRVSFAKVAEYQKRGAVHFHAVVRLDGPDGPADPPPAWATAEALADAIRSAAEVVAVELPHTAALGEHSFRWGKQLDIHEIAESALTSPVAVASYIGKYVSKSVTETGGTDRPVKTYEQIKRRKVNTHLRTLMQTCWRLGELSELRHLNLHRWTHTLGFRGHCLTKSLRYSTTYRALRAARMNYKNRYAANTEGVEIDSAWRYVRSGLSPAEYHFVTGMAHGLAERRDPVQLSNSDGR